MEQWVRTYKINRLYKNRWLFPSEDVDNWWAANIRSDIFNLRSTLINIFRLIQIIFPFLWHLILKCGQVTEILIYLLVCSYIKYRMFSVYTQSIFSFNFFSVVFITYWKISRTLCRKQKLKDWREMVNINQYLFICAFVAGSSVFWHVARRRLTEKCHRLFSVQCRWNLKRQM